MAPRPFALLLLALVFCPQWSFGQTLEEQLIRGGVDAAAAAAVREGDARRGALLFHQPILACGKCHAGAQDKSPNLGPDLTKLGVDATSRHVVESILEPSKSIRPEFRTVIVSTADGKSFAGIVAGETFETLSLRSAGDGQVLELAKSDITEREIGRTSLMPSGQVNQLASRQQFYDLVKYVVEIGQGGPDRARQLQPPPESLALSLPEYEQHLDHRRMIESLDDKSLHRGEAIYQRVCANCHGTLEQVGSLPTSRRFASDTFKNGASPYALYQTLTRGFGLMPPQVALVPRQKYDVIHYLRETFLRSNNPSQYVDLTAAELAALPDGDTFGPEPPRVEPWRKMNYGETLMSTYEIGDDGSNFAHKGIAVRLDRGEGGVAQGAAWLVFDHDTLRVAGVWTGQGFIDWHGIRFDGAHQIHPRIVGELIASNPTGPGWCKPGVDDRDDPRIVGRDGKRYGPLPRDWAHYRGLYRHGHLAVIEYTVGKTRILESPRLVELPTPDTLNDEPAASEPTIVARVMNVGERSTPLELLVATEPNAAVELSTVTLIRSRHGKPIVASNDRATTDPRLTPTSHATTVRMAVFDRAERGSTSRRRSPITEQERGEMLTANSDPLIVGFTPAEEGIEWRRLGDELRLRLPPGPPLRFVVWMARGKRRPDLARKADLANRVEEAALEMDLESFTRGGPAVWTDTLTTAVQIGANDGPLSVDVLSHPADNPWFAQMRFTGFDFFPDGDRVVIADWDGDVWIVSGLTRLNAAAPGAVVDLSWRRIASGLFEPLGVKIVRGDVYVACRDQIVILRDKNGDGEIDFYQNFNNDHQVTEHFHEFAMGLQTDAQGNFYYAKSARHALPAVVPHHGTLLRVSPDGEHTEIVATGFRAANGVCLNPDGSFVVTDQEGHWNPKNRINWVKAGGFYGNMFGYHDVTDESDAAMEQPLAWITNAFDRSPAELLWIESDRWKPLEGLLLNLSYGYGRVYVTPFENINGVRQGGMCQLPLPDFPTGIIRGRFHPVDGELYLCGMSAWATSVAQPGGFYRVRLTGKPLYAPRELHSRRDGLEIALTDPVDRVFGEDAANYDVKVWSLRRSANYGSNHVDEHSLRVENASVSADGRRLTLNIANFGPTQCMEVVCRMRSPDGEPIMRTIHATVHQLGE